MKSFSKRPIRGYNVDPFGYTVEQIYEGPYNLEAISDNSSHGILKIENAIHLECVENGWHISLIYTFMKSVKNFLSRFEEIKDEDGKTSYKDKEGKFQFEGRILLDLEGKDRIQTALRFLEAIS